MTVNEPGLDSGVALYRTARKQWRCVAADEVLYWRVRTRKTGDPDDWDWSGSSGRYTTEVDADEAAKAKVGTPASYDMREGSPTYRQPSGWYTAAEAEPVPNPNHASRSPDCRGDIHPGHRYVEYVGESAAWQSGQHYCLPCGIATWRADQ